MHSVPVLGCMLGCKQPGHWSPETAVVVPSLLRATRHESLSQRVLLARLDSAKALSAPFHAAVVARWSRIGTVWVCLHFARIVDAARHA